MSLPATQYSWYALTVKNHHEKAVARALEGKGYAQFLPLYPSQHRSGGRVQSVLLPLFPGYIFCSFDPAHRLPILTIPGVGSVVGIGKTPAPIAVQELEQVENILNSPLPVEPWPFLRCGDAVYIDSGPLRGLEGTLIASKGRCRVVVSVSLLQRSVCTEVDIHSVRPAHEFAPARDLHAA